MIRKKLRKTGIKHLKVVYSPELPIESIDQPDISCRYHCICPAKDMRACTERHTIPSSNAWVPATAGLICGGEVVKDLVNNAHTMRVDLQEDPDNVYAKKAAEKKAAYLDDYKKRVAERKKAKAMADNDNKKGKVLETEGGKEALRDAGADI